MFENNNDKIALLLGYLDDGGVRNSLKANGFIDIKHKILHSSVGNWIKIANLIEESPIENSIILTKFSEKVIFLACLPGYKDAAKQIFDQMKRRNHLILIYSENLFGNYSANERPASIFHSGQLHEVDGTKRNGYWDHFGEVNYHTILEQWCYQYNYDDPRSMENRMKELVGNLNSGGWNINPYRTLVEVDLTCQTFIEGVSKGLIMRIYIPSNRLWSNETDKLLELFQEFAVSVSESNLTLKRHKTKLGNIYLLYSSERDISRESLSDIYSDFTSFAKLCSEDPEAALKMIIERYDISDDKARKLLNKFVKDSKRLFLDIAQDKESKLLELRHRLESEFLDAEIEKDFEKNISGLLPSIEKLDKLTTTVNITTGSGGGTFHISNSNINQINSIVAETINGNINYNENDLKLQDLFSKYADDNEEIVELNSSLGELKNKELEIDLRTSAWQRIETFLSKVWEKFGDIGVMLLKKYIESEL